MAYDEITDLLGGWEGFELVAVRREPATASQPVPRIVLELQPLAKHPKRCSGVVKLSSRSTTRRSGACVICLFWSGKPGWYFRESVCSVRAVARLWRRCPGWIATSA